MAGQAPAKAETPDFEDILKAHGFASQQEFSSMVARARLSTPEERAAFKAWQEEDGTKAGLQKLLIPEPLDPHPEPLPPPILLDPCPFCGNAFGVPMLRKDEDHSSGKRSLSYSVACRCTARGRFAIQASPDEPEDSIQRRAAGLWNERRG